MSDPVTNVEIEDVLASIRRLVSDEPAPSDDGPQAQAQAAKADKLVLTPSLRVADGRDMGAAGSVATASIAKEPARVTMPEPLPDPMAEPAPAMQLGAEYAVSADQGADDLHVDEAEALSGDEGDMVADDGAIEITEADVVENVAFSDRVAGLEAAVAEADEQWEPDGGEEDAFAFVEVEAPYWEEGEDDDALSAEVTALHTPREAVQDDAAADADLADADMADAHSTDADNTAALDDLAGLGLAQGMIDEEMLRELVAEIVRQELQGSLGERITRNVRKLVRREIQRALTSRDLS